MYIRISVTVSTLPHFTTIGASSFYVFSIFKPPYGPTFRSSVSTQSWITPQSIHLSDSPHIPNIQTLCSPFCPPAHTLDCSTSPHNPARNLNEISVSSKGSNIRYHVLLQIMVFSRRSYFRD
ncbi:hypothetical protein EX30DRAFT_53793 [Ascodesmis nigricans]|uniref:Uncharacterized protein n=1 Tax=Ascodesmis nigricans TaxID=341454 RepID=A0A4V3SIL6_9PEZI|nr:hypothetical protein EX30DRAFT_53793 [Ascodesmis nigricans]